MQCEACRIAPVAVSNTDDDSYQPYQICDDCNVRLVGLALRPLEWFNLASTHGPNKHLLHDDFYDDDGTAFQAEIPVDDASSFPAPSLPEVAGKLPRLIDMATTQWFLADNVVNAINEYEPNVVLDSIVSRTENSKNGWVESTCLQVCARCIGQAAAEWVESRYGKSSDLLYSWAQAAAACMPIKDAWRLTVDSIARSKNVREDAQSLGWFRSNRTLDWIQNQLPELDLPATQDWGRLAAISQLSWRRIESWLALGRPLSLVALDSMVACFHYDTLNLKRIQPKLTTDATPAEMTTALDRYANKDDVPRVARTVSRIKSNLTTIIADTR